MVGNAGVGGGTGDPTDMATSFKGNTCNPRATKWGINNSGGTYEMRRYLHNSYKQFHKSGYATSPLQ
jgi:hypothetical protein